MTGLYKDGYVPPEALSWNDADDNNAYHEKLFVMNFDGTLSPELVVITKNPKGYNEEMRVMNLPAKNDGTPMAAQVGAGGGFVPKGAKNIEVAKDFMKFFMQPAVMNANLKAGLGRWAPAMPHLVKEDPFWLSTEMPCLKPYITEAVLNPTIPVFEGFTPAWGQANAEQLWGQCHADVIKNGMTAQAAVDKAFKRAEAIFTKYTFG
jgi:multiple sugar transport system substrate-binding protein